MSGWRSLLLVLLAWVGAPVIAFLVMIVHDFNRPMEDESIDGAMYGVLAGFLVAISTSASAVMSWLLRPVISRNETED